MNGFGLREHADDMVTLALEEGGYEQITRRRLLDWVTRELTRAGRFVPDPDPNEYKIWISITIGMLSIYLISILTVVLALSKYPEKTFAGDYGEGLGAGGVLSMLFFLGRYIYDRGIRDIVYCIRHRRDRRNNTKRLCTNFFQQLALHLFFGWVASFPLVPLLWACRGV